MMDDFRRASTCFALAGGLALASGGVATSAPLLTQELTSSGKVNVEPVYYRHYRHYGYYNHYYYGPGPAVGAAIAGAALGLIGGAVAAATYPYPYGYYGPSPYYGYYYGPGYYAPGPYYYYRW